MHTRPAVRSIVALGALAAACFAAPNARAQTVFFTNRAAFNTAAGTLAFESFESVAASGGASVTAGPVTVAEINGSPNQIYSDTNASDSSTSLPTDGSKFLDYIDNGASIGVISFAAPINAFGIDIASDSVTSVTVGGGAVTTLALVGKQPRFFGFINFSGTFSQVTFDASGTPEIGFDALSYGTVTPEPGITALFAGICVTGAGFVRRRRARR